MSDSEALLDLIEACVVEHGGDLGGWTRRDGDGDGASLHLFDGRVTLRATVSEGGPGGGLGAVHAHVVATLHEHDDEELDACLFGMGDDRESALKQAAVVWLTAVAGPIRSFLDDRPVCMTCQANVEGGDIAKGYAPGGFGLPPGLRAYVGPSITRGIEEPPGGPGSPASEALPWFRYAAESAAPRRVHLAKATVVHQGAEGWRRELEIDGHDVSHRDPDWPDRPRGPGFGYMTRFAVFEFPRNSKTLARRAKLEKAIRRFAESYAKFDSAEELMADMVARGHDPALVREVEAFSTIAFGRALFEPLGVKYPATIFRARQDGRVQADVPLMGLPAYSRARALAAKLRETMPQDEFQSLCLYNAESHAIVNSIEAAKGKPDFESLTLYPLVVPDPGASDETMEAALAALRVLIDRSRPAASKKPWWKFW
ncbi:hypothetical protein OJF2_70480 [Aquisphaera giovannonii]|uniref:Uncharacterized protein n=1 Tax=Aquisphaera giovannonii TaxID=406548 RepID=A0A5B9WEH0_9BACT|nr:DUF6348 family protein [Aquisphaera giovannonii]QEH38445.1 hypothetical protein OJF2_70480 [Aquisphaera giovannonii]